MGCQFHFAFCPQLFLMAPSQLFWHVALFLWRPANRWHQQGQHHRAEILVEHQLPAKYVKAFLRL